MENLYLFYGEELYLLEDTVKKIKKNFGDLIEGINYIKIDETNINNLIADIQTPSFGYEKKLIIVRNSGLIQKQGKKKNTYLTDIMEKVADYIKNNIEDVISNNVIIFIEDEIEKNNLYNIIEQYGKIVNFEFEKLPSLIKRVKAIASAYKVNISDENAKYLIECCGTSVQDIVNEIRKLIEYKGENGVIEKQDIDILAVKQIDSIIFDLTDSLGKKNIKNAMEVLNNLIYQKEPIQKILISLYNHFKKLYFVKIAVKEKMNIAEALNLKANQNFLVSKYTVQSNYFEEIELKTILKELCDLDYKYKTGLIDINIGVETILCNYCS